MKKIFYSIAFLFMTVQFAQACDIDIHVHHKEKESYKAGDEVIFKVNVRLTHRICIYGIEATKFGSDGLELMGATPWKQLSDYDYSRLVKAKVKEEAEKTATFRAVRTCEKGGGKAAIEIKIE